MSIQTIVGKKGEKTNISQFSSSHTYIKLTLVSFFLLLFFAPFSKAFSLLKPVPSNLEFYRFICHDCESHCNCQKVNLVSLIASYCSRIQVFCSGIIYSSIHKIMMANYGIYLFIKVYWQKFLSHFDVNGGGRGPKT